MMRTFAKVALSAAVASVSMTVAGQALEEVVVTAQKRTESLQDVPISVTAIGRELIQDASIRSFALLVEAVLPQLNYAVDERAITLAELSKADAVLISNTVRGVIAVSRIEDQHYSKGALPRCIQDALTQQVVSCSAR